MATAHTNNRFNLYRAVTDRILELLENGVIPWRKPWSSAGPPMNADTKRIYTGVNHLLLVNLPYGSNLYLTFEQVKNLGGSVNRGEKGHLVVLWILPEKSEREETNDEHPPKKAPFLRYYKVFNVEQCNHLPPHVLESGYARQVHPVAVCEGIVQTMPHPPRIRFGKAKAFYNPKEDVVNLPAMKRFDDSDAYYGTLFHELVHSTGHESRLKRKGVTEAEGFGTEAYSFEELVAELGSAYLCAHAGIGQKELKYQAAYIKAWLERLKSDAKMIVFASAQAQKAVDYILCRNGDVALIGSSDNERA